MPGVEILATQEVAVACGFYWFGFVVCAIALAFIGTMIGWACDSRNFVSGWAIGLIFGLIGGLVLGTAVGFDNGDPVEYETQYKVLITDEVSINEFLERYEIIDQEGKIYTVREVEDGK